MSRELLLLNPWWKEKKVSKELAKEYKRKIFTETLRYNKYRQILVLSGLRRVGKSTLMFQLIEKELEKRDPEKIVYFSFDSSVKNLTEIMENYKELTGVNWEKEKLSIYFDEIQKLDNWTSKLKLLYDNFPNLRFVVSGSSSVRLEKEAMTDLTGRHFALKVKPLSFREFLELTKSKINLDKPKIWEKEIKKEFNDYLTKPFPEIVNWKSSLLIKKYLKESVIDKIIRTDLPDKFKDVSEDLLLKLVEIFFNEQGLYLSYDNLAVKLGVSKKTLVNHIFYLEFAFLIRKVKNFRSKEATASRKMQRIYPSHWSLALAMNGEISSESVVSSMLETKQYWRKNEKEVDFIIKNKTILPIEVKGERVRKEDLKNLIYFCQKNKLKKAFLVYSGERKTEKINGIKIEFVPLWELALNKKLVS
jgi:uncharacterized protein